MLKELQQEVERCIESLEQEEGVKAVQSIRQIVQQLKALQPSVQQSPLEVTEQLYEKMLEGIVDVAQDVAKEKYTYAYQYVERVFEKDVMLLERLLQGENPFEEKHWIGFYNPDWNPRQAANTERTGALERAAREQSFETIYFTNDSIQGEQIIGTDYTGKENVIVVPEDLHVLSAQGSRTYRNQTKKERYIRRKTPVLQHIITDKLHLPLELHGESELSGLFIPSILVHDSEEILSFLNKHQVGVLKDVQIERGEGIYFLQKREDSYIVRQQLEQFVLKEHEFISYVERVIKGKTFLIQKYIDSKLDGTRAADVRIYTAKDCVGRWGVRKVYMRLSAEDNILTHTYYGGERTDAEQYFKDIYGEVHGAEAYESIRSIAYQVSKDVDHLYGYACDEFGIDLVIDNNDQIWMYEVNTGPWTGFFEEERAYNLMSYAKYLAVSGVMPHNRFQDRVGFRSEESELLRYVVEEGQFIIGLLTESFDEMARALALEASNREQLFFVFRPDDVDAEHPYVRGFRLEKGEWQPYIVPYPHFILDRLRKREDEYYTYLYSQFEHIPMTYSFEQKRLEIEQLHRLLSQEEALKELLYPTALPQSLNAAIRFIERTTYCYMYVVEESPYKIMIRRDGVNWHWHEKGYHVICTDRELRERLKPYVAKSIFLQEAPSSVTRLRLHYVLQEEEWKRVVTYPVTVAQVEEWADDEPLEQYMELVPFANTKWNAPQKTLDELHAKADEVMAKIGEALQIDLHHVQLDFNVSREGELHFVHASMDEPTSMYVAQPLARAMMQYVCEQLQQ